MATNSLTPSYTAPQAPTTGAATTAAPAPSLTTGYTPSAGAAATAQSGLALGASSSPISVEQRAAVVNSVPQAQIPTPPPTAYANTATPVANPQQPTTPPAPTQDANNPQFLQQMSDYISKMAQVPPENYQGMNSQQLATAIQGSSQALNTTIGQMGSIIQEVVKVGSPNVQGILSNYMNQINGYLDQFAQQAQDAYNNGMNDPGLLQAINIINDQAKTMKGQLDEELNARGMSQSGVWINAMQQFDKGVEQQQATIISDHLSQITKNLQDAMQSVLNQRVAALTQFAGISSQAEIETTKMQIDKLSAALQGMTNVMNTQAGVLSGQRDAYDTQKKLEEQQAEFQRQMELEQKKLEEQIRANKAQESIARTAASARTSAGGGKEPSLTDTMQHQIYVSKNISDLYQQYANGKLSSATIMSGLDNYRNMAGVNTDNPQELAAWNDFVNSINRRGSGTSTTTTAKPGILQNTINWMVGTFTP